MGAIEFARARYVSRSTGGSATLLGSYVSREAIYCERTGQTYNFSDRTKPLHCEVLLPPGSPSGLDSVSALTNAMEKAENRKNSQVVRELVFALPAAKEIGHGDRVELLRSFAQEHFISKGLGVVIAIHQPDPLKKGDEVDLTSDTANWHGHMLVTTRYITEAGLGAKARDLDPQVRRGAQGKAFVTEAEKWGPIWRDHQNAYFRAQGLTLRVDPTAIHTNEHLGPVRFRGEAGEETAKDAATRQAKNAEAARDPVKVVEHLTERNATFTDRDIDAFLRKFLGDATERREVKGKIQKLPFS